MKTKLWGGIGVLVSVAASVSVANAADLGVRAPVYKAPPVIMSDWAGFYIGVNGGGGWGNSSIDGFSLDKASGGVFGGQLGYNWQFGSFVTGVEADLDGADISSTTQGATVKTNELASVRAREGYAFLPNLLAYGTVGFAYGRTNVVGIDLAQNGWVAGAGLEYKVSGPWIARAEYLHYGFGNAAIGGVDVKTDVDVVRGGLSYKF